MEKNVQRLYDILDDLAGDCGCAGQCTESELYWEDGEWRLFLCGFMEPWPLGRTPEEAENRLRSYAASGFGVGPG